jgi:predicted dehydrogenase
MRTIAEKPAIAERARPESRFASGKLRVGLIGCGDVAHRRYLPALAQFADRVELVGCCDSNPDAAERAARAALGWSPGVGVYTELSELLRRGQLDAAINLTPAPAHGPVTLACLEAGVHVYSEKPIAASLAEADRLIATAARNDLLLLCAPAMAATRWLRWLAEIVASGRLGRLTLAVTHHADTGPASWREYTGDPEVFYGPGVGPVFDHGVYPLHAITALLGPVRRVQAMGATGDPTRVIRAGPRAGQTFAVTSPDHVLMNLEFANGALGQLLASFAAPRSQNAWLELHFSGGTVSFAGTPGDLDAPASIFFDDESPLGLEGWVHGLQPPPPRDGFGVVETGVAHFIACLRGEERPVLTAAHARHVLDVILKAYLSIADGRSHDTETTMEP